MMMSRREVLKMGGRSAAWGLPSLLGLSSCRKAVNCTLPDEAANAEPLKVAAEKRNLLFGAAVDRAALEPDPRYAETVIAECSLVHA